MELSKNEIERQDRQRALRGKRVKSISLWLIGVAVTAELGSDHVPDGQRVGESNSTPPTSGPHYAQPADWGVYEQPLLDERLVHNLEHGGIWLSYRDADDTALTAQLRDIADDYTLKVIMTPRPENDARIAVAAWGRLLKLE